MKKVMNMNTKKKNKELVKAIFVQKSISSKKVINN